MRNYLRQMIEDEEVDDIIIYRRNSTSGNGRRLGVMPPWWCS
jgi:hypothetical protein